MVEVILGPNQKDLLKTWDKPYTLRLYDVSEELFDELVDEDTRAELIDGVMIVHSPATMSHDDCSGFIRFLMRGYASRRKLGKVLGPDSLFHPGPGRKFAPDAYFLLQLRVLRPWPKEFQGIPDLVLEILSPSNRREDLNEKCPLYRAAGILEIWIVDPENQQVTIERKKGKRYVKQVIEKGKAASTILSGFWIETAWLWSSPLPDDLECLQEILGEN